MSSRVRSKSHLYSSHVKAEESSEQSKGESAASTRSPSSTKSPRSQQTIVPMRFGPAVSVPTSSESDHVGRRSPNPKRPSSLLLRSLTPPKSEQAHSPPKVNFPSLSEPHDPIAVHAIRQSPPSQAMPLPTVHADQYTDSWTTIGVATGTVSYLSSPKTDFTSLTKDEVTSIFTLPGPLFSTRTPTPQDQRNGDNPRQERSPSPPWQKYATPEGSPEERKSAGKTVTDGDTITTPTMRGISPLPSLMVPTSDFAEITSSRVSVAGSIEPPLKSAYEFESIQEHFTIESTSLSADSLYAKQRRSLLDILNRLHSTGVQKDIDLPQIVVIGSQSVGKSSLIESMSGVSLPRDVGTCTRCPVECRLEYSTEPWSCRVFLRLERDPSGAPLDHVEEHDFGPILTDRTAVEDTLRRAQRALLRPSLDKQLFLQDKDLTIKEHPPLSFSHNCVCMRIKGPDVPDLYFYDLPGLIVNVREGSDVKDIELVHDLVQTYISKPSCLILLTVSCETDFENQGAGRLALESDSNGQRIVGVLTKPDRIENATGEKWMSVLRNEESRLVNGWFCVKQPNPTELKQKISWEEARRREDAFFANQEPWKSLEDPHRGRLGSYNLIRYLSGLLSGLVAQRLPDVEKDLLLRLEDVNTRLKQLPVSKFQDPSSELVNLVFEFAAEISRNIKGVANFEDSRPGLIPSIRVAQKNFRSSIIRTAPKFCPWARQDTPQTSPHSVRSETTDLPVGPVAWFAEPEFLSDEEQASFERRTGRVLYLDEVMEFAERSITRELPGDYPFSVKEDLIRMCLRGWSRPMLQYFDTVHNLMAQYMKSLVDRHFGNYLYSGLHAKVMAIVRDQLRKRHERTLERLNAILSTEELPFTVNHTYLKDFKGKFLAHYRDIRRRSRGQDLIIKGFQDVDDALSRELHNDIDELTMLLRRFGLTCTPADLPRLLPEDDLEPALDIMATVRAYFQVAYKRFVDVVPLEVDMEFVRSFDRKIRDSLVVALDVKSSAQCAIWLADSPETAERRRELLAAKQRLEAARDELSSFFTL